MNKITVLPPHVADLIAAGEVVERPASAAKELIENAVDAGAQTVTVEIRRGGLDMLRVADDGSGIAPQDVEAAFLRHATSKIRGADDLAAIGTLGFRGEALSSIAAVARVDMYSAVAGEASGRLIELEGGEVKDFREAGCPVGTTIVVKDLFYNTPARMKFLKRDQTEAKYVQGVVQRAALAAPHVAMKFIRDGETVFGTPGDGALASAVYALYGRAFTETLLPVAGAHEGVAVEGFISKPSEAQGSRQRQLFFVGGRPVQSRLIGAALEEPYKNRLTAGRFPAAILHVASPPELVDVNVHPAKTEVKFAFERHIFDAVYLAVKSALEAESGRRPIVSASRAPSYDGARGEAVPAKTFEQLALLAGRPAPGAAESLAPPIPHAPAVYVPYTDGAGRAAPVPQTSDAGENLVREPVRTYAPSIRHLPDIGASDMPLRGGGTGAAARGEGDKDPVPQASSDNWVIRGEVFSSYIVVEDGDDMLLIDKHAAHERVIFERLKAARRRPMAQLLIEPVIHTPEPEAREALLGALPFLRSIGFEAEEFGGGSLIVRAAPEGLGAEDVRPSLDEISENLRLFRRAPEPKREDEVLHLVACKAALKAGSATSPEEMRALVRQVMTLPDVKYCPHGRPVALCLSRAELERRFGRA